MVQKHTNQWTLFLIYITKVIVLWAQSYFNIFHVALDALHYEFFMFNVTGAFLLMVYNKTEKLKMISHGSIAQFADSYLLLLKEIHNTHQILFRAVRVTSDKAAIC